MAAVTNNRDNPSKYTECVRCGCVFSFTTKPDKNAKGESEAAGKPSDAAFDLDHRAQLEKGPVPVACPVCHYLPAAELLKGRMSSTVTLLFLIAFPGVALMVVKGIAAQPDLDLPPRLMGWLAILCEAVMAGLGALAVASLLFYHPSRLPFSKWSARGILLREGRPREQWGIAAVPVAEPAPAAASVNADDIDPSKIVLPPEDPDEEDGFSAPEPQKAAPARIEPARDVAPARARPPATVAVSAPAAQATVVASADSAAPVNVAPAADQKAASDHSMLDHTHEHAAAPNQVILECPQCHKKFRAPRSVLQRMPKCKYCRVELEDTLDI